MHDKCEEITEVKTLLESFKDLPKAVNTIKGGLVIIGILVLIFLWAVKDTRSQVDRVDRRLDELITVVNSDLKALAVSNAEQRMEIKQLSKDIGITNSNVVWIQNRLIDKEK